MATAAGMAFGKVYALHQQIFGATEPTPRQDSAGAAMPLDLSDYQRQIIVGVYKDEAPEILERLDAKPASVRAELLDDYVHRASRAYAKSLVDAQIIGIARNRTTAAGDRADAKTDPLVEAMGRQRDPHTAAIQGA
jgi:hypothetical protein